LAVCALFESAGHEVEVQPLLDDGYLGELYKTGRRGWRWLATGMVAPAQCSSGYAALMRSFAEQESMSISAGFIELFFQRLSPRFFVDYDDAPYANYSRWPIFRGKIPQIMALAETVRGWQQSPGGLRAAICAARFV